MLRRLVEPFLKRYVRPRFGITAEYLATFGPFAVPYRPATRDRVLLLRRHISKASKVLEFGPLGAPLVAKRDGWNVFSVDNADRAALLERCKDMAFVDPDKVEEVDFVWTGGSILDVVPPEHFGSFDVVVMSHVLEHIPDPLRFLADIARLLKPDGRISLAFPDKRHCFDAYRPVTQVSAWMEANLRGDTIHTRQTLFEHFAYALGKKAQISWIETHMRAEDLSLMGGIGEAHRTYYGPRPPQSYVDCHAWIATPASFALLVHDCHALGLSPFALDEVTFSHSGEFIAHLTVAPRTPIAEPQRLQLILLSAEEQAAGYAGFRPARPDPMRAFVRRFVPRKRP